MFTIPDLMDSTAASFTERGSWPPETAIVALNEAIASHEIELSQLAAVVADSTGLTLLFRPGGGKRLQASHFAAAKYNGCSTRVAATSIMMATVLKTYRGGKARKLDLLLGHRRAPLGVVVEGNCCKYMTAKEALRHILAHA